jgi:hypothetical protein
MQTTKFAFGGRLVTTEAVAVRLSTGSTILVEAAVRGEEDVASSAFAFDDVEDSIVSLSQALKGILDKIKPSSASVEFGIEIEVESGKLTALLVKGTSKANLKITLNWGE